MRIKLDDIDRDCKNRLSLHKGVLGIVIVIENEEGKPAAGSIQVDKEELLRAVQAL